MYCTYDIVGGISATVESSTSLKARFEAVSEKHKDKNAVAAMASQMFLGALFEFQDLGHGRCRIIYADPQRVRGAAYRILVAEPVISVKRPKAGK
jgi:hypothetical protein